MAAAGEIIGMTGLPVALRLCEKCRRCNTFGETCPASLRCPTCGSTAVRCRRPSGHDAAEWHRARLKAAADVDAARGGRRRPGPAASMAGGPDPRTTEPIPEGFHTGAPLIVALRGAGGPCGGWLAVPLEEEAGVLKGDGDVGNRVDGLVGQRQLCSLDLTRACRACEFR